MFKMEMLSLYLLLFTISYKYTSAKQVYDYLLFQILCLVGKIILSKRFIFIMNLILEHKDTITISIITYYSPFISKVITTMGVVSKYINILEKTIFVYRFYAYEGKIEAKNESEKDLLFFLYQINLFFSNKNYLETTILDVMTLGIDDLVNYVLTKIRRYENTVIFISIILLFANPFIFFGIGLFIFTLEFWESCVYKCYKKGYKLLFFSLLVIFLFLVLLNLITLIYGLYILVDSAYVYMKRSWRGGPHKSGSPESDSSGSQSGPSGSGPSGPTESGPSGSYTYGESRKSRSETPTAEEGNIQHTELEREEWQFEIIKRAETDSAFGFSDFDYDVERVFDIATATDGTYYKRYGDTNITNKYEDHKESDLLHKYRLARLETQLLEDWKDYQEKGFVRRNQEMPKVTLSSIFNGRDNKEKPASFPISPPDSGYHHSTNKYYIKRSVKHQYVNYPVWLDQSPYNRLRRERIWKYNKEFKEKLLEKGKSILDDRNLR